MADNNLLFIIVIILIAIGIWYFCFRDKKSHFEPGDHRPIAGDFLPTVGSVPSEGGYEELDAEGSVPVSNLDEQLCEECVSHCVSEKVRLGKATTFSNDRATCFEYCKIECNPESGF